MPSGFNFWHNRMDTAYLAVQRANEELMLAEADMTPDDSLCREATEAVHRRLLKMAKNARALAASAERLALKLPTPIEDKRSP